MYAGSNIRLPVNNRCRAYATRMSFYNVVYKNPASRFPGVADPSSKPSRNAARIVHTPSVRMPWCAMRRVNPRWRNGVKELNRPLKVTSQPIDRPTRPSTPSVANEFGAYVFPSVRFNRWDVLSALKASSRIYNRVTPISRSWITSYGSLIARVKRQANSRVRDNIERWTVK